MFVNTEAGQEEVPYDKCLLSPGGAPVVPDLDNLNLDNIHTFRGPDDTKAVRSSIAQSKQAVVIGSGYIGIEVAEAYAKAGIEVTVLDLASRMLATYLDKEFTCFLENRAKKAGIYFIGEQKVTGFTGENGKVTGVVTEDKTYPADTVILAMGVRTDTEWLGESIERDEKGFIIVNEYLETSAPDVYAGGDSIRVPYAPTEGQAAIGLATLARREGIIAALNALGQKRALPELTGTSALSLCGLNFVTTGLKDCNQDTYPGEVAACYVEEPLYPEFMRQSERIKMKIHYDKHTHRILGAQLMSEADISAAIAALSIAIQSKWTLEDLALADIFFQPRFDRPWHYLNVLAMAALDYQIGGADRLLF